MTQHMKKTDGKPDKVISSEVEDRRGMFRRPTLEVPIGPVTIGGGLNGSVIHPVAVQSMCDTDTNDIEASVAPL